MQNYGNSEDPDIRAYTNAYMLVYIAKNAKEEVLCPVTERDIPPSLRSRFLEEQSVDEQKQKFKDSAHEFLTVNILLEEDFNGYEGPEIFRLDLLPVRSVRVRKDVDGKKLVKEVAKALEWDPATTRLWQVSQREKGSYLIEFNLPKLTEPCLSSTLIFWAQQVPANLTGTPLSLTASSPPASRLFFFKYFDPTSCTLSFCGSLELNSTVPATYLPRVLRERAGLPPDTPLIFFREFVNRVIQAIEPASLLTPPSRSGIHGEVIFFQIDPGCPLLYNSCLVAEETGKDAASLIGTLAKSYDNMQPATLDHPYLRFLAGISNRRYYKALFEEVLVKLSELCLSDRFRPDVKCSPVSAELKGCALKVPKKRKPTRRQKRKQPDSGRFGHVIEVCDVPLEKGLSLLWLHFTEGGFYAERVTPSCLLAKFSSCAEARRALELLAKEFVKARSMLEASDEAKARILRSPAEWALTFKPRPQTDSSVASRLILSHLSLTGPLPDPPVTTKDRLLQSPHAEILGRGNDRIARETIEAWHTGTNSINRCVALPAAYQALRAQLSKQMSRRAPRLNMNPDMSEPMADTHSATPQPGSDEGAVLTTAGPSTSPADGKTDSRCGVNKIASLGRQLRSMKVRTTTTNVSTPASDVD
nr:unnamed protein product [Spirometra erinaceieuropaei]